MAEEMIEFVAKADCLCDGEPLYRGESYTLPKSVVNELRAAGRVCNADEAAAFIAQRKPSDSKPKGKADA